MINLIMKMIKFIKKIFNHKNNLTKNKTINKINKNI